MLISRVTEYLSNLRNAGGPNAQFVVRGHSSLDPSSRYELRLLKTSKDHREIMMTQGHGTIFGGSATSKLEEGALRLRFENMVKTRIALRRSSR
jgi:hypothetical protein